MFSRVPGFGPTTKPTKQISYILFETDKFMLAQDCQIATCSPGAYDHGEGDETQLKSASYDQWTFVGRSWERWERGERIMIPFSPCAVWPWLKNGNANIRR